MKRFWGRFAAALFMLFLIAIIAAGQGATLYVNRVVLAGPGDVSLGDLVRPSGDLGPEAQEALARSVAVMSDKVLYIPVSLYLAQLEAAFGTDSIIVGSRSIVVPRGALPDGETYLLEKLADFLEGQGLVGNLEADLALVQNTVNGVPPQEGVPVFQVLRTTKGSTEVTFKLSDTAGNSLSGRVSLAAGTLAAASSEGVKNGTAVQVLFRKGPITIEMPGKALSSAGPGEKVSVVLSDSQKSFSGRVIDAKAVQVDLP